jgi:hypothetical protein
MAKEQKTESTGADMPKVNWDDSNMSTSYANVCNVSSSREEVTLLFGTNQAWHTGQEPLCCETPPGASGQRGRAVRDAFWQVGHRCRSGNRSCGYYGNRRIKVSMIFLC